MSQYYDKFRDGIGQMQTYNHQQALRAKSLREFQIKEKEKVELIWNQEKIAEANR